MMNLKEFQNILSSYKLPATIEGVISHYSLRLLGRGIVFVLVLIALPAFGVIGGFQELGTAIFILLSAVLVAVLALDAVIYSYAFRKNAEKYEYKIASIALHAKESDPVRSFLNLEIGRETIMRSGIEIDLMRKFLVSRTMVSPGSALRIQDKAPRAQAYIYALTELDQQFLGFLSAHGVTPDIFWKAFQMAADRKFTKLRGERWWSESALASIHPIGREWAYGEAYFLSRFSEPLRVTEGNFIDLHEDEIQRLYSILMKERGANALIVGDEGVGKMEIVEGLHKVFARSESRASVPRILVLRTESLLAHTDHVTLFEETLIKIFREIEKAGNIILVIPDIALLVRTAHSFQIELSSIIGPYLRSSTVHIVAIVDTDDVFDSVEKESELGTRFERIQVKDASREEVLLYLEGRVDIIERESRSLLSYPALEEAVKLAEQYFVDVPLSHATEDLLFDALSHAQGQGRAMLIREDVWAVAEARTGIETGTANTAERARLEKLEELLHERIVGQDDAIGMIADSLRRARAGIRDASRPLGSFLFFGPTGVGKTETAKALAEVFFGGENKILRLDMSEFNSVDAVEKLIGSYSGDGAGILSSMVREHPYGVLLLDEFEKTSSKVLDIFLQILDEGIFHDAAGRKISARNLIIVATSNAGSDLFFELKSPRNDISALRSEIIEAIVERGIFKPELLNRFDGVVLFHTIQDAELRTIARMQLKQLEWRLKEKGMKLEPTDALIDFLVKEGTDPKYGARPLERAIKDTVESVIARGILEGKYKTGSIIELTPGDLQKNA